MDNCQRIELLKDVFTLIYPDLVKEGSEEQERDNEERRNRVQAWLTDTKQTAAQEENPWKDEPQGRGEQLSVMPRFLQLLRECLLTHHWAQVLAMLTCLTYVPYGADWAVWKATMTTMYTEPENNISFIQEFFKHTYLLKECNVCDMALEFVQYLISQGKTQEASKVIQTARKGNPRNKSEYQRELTDHCLLLLEAYQGMIFYSDWKAALSAHQQSQSQSLSQSQSQSFFNSSQMSQSFYNLTSSQGPSEEAVDSMARRASLGLDAVVKKPGVWDIFLTKSVEIHEYYEEYSKAEQLLCAYRNRNPDNPNAHKFLYEHLTRCCAHHDEKYVQEESISCLKSLAKLDPANPLVLTLWQMLTDGGESGEALCHAFDFLDYGQWQTTSEGWQCLAKSLATGLSRKKKHHQQQQAEDVKDIAARESFLSVLDNCWSSRQDWWPQYYFDCQASALTASHDDHQQLLSSKAFVAAVLIDRDCSFTTEVRELLNASSLQSLNETLSELDWAAVSEFTARHGTPPRGQVPGTTGDPIDGATSPNGSEHPSPSLSASSGRLKKRRKARHDTQSDVDCAVVSEFTVGQAPSLVSGTPGDLSDGATGTPGDLSDGATSPVGNGCSSPSTVAASPGSSRHRKKTRSAFSSVKEAVSEEIVTSPLTQSGRGPISVEDEHSSNIVQLDLSSSGSDSSADRFNAASKTALSEASSASSEFNSSSGKSDTLLRRSASSQSKCASQESDYSPDQSKSSSDKLNTLSDRANPSNRPETSSRRSSKDDKIFPNLRTPEMGGNESCNRVSQDVRPVEGRRLKYAKRKEKRIDTEGSALKICDTSDEASCVQRTESGGLEFKIWGVSEDASYSLNQQTLEEMATSSSKNCGISGDASSLLHQQTIEETTSTSSLRKKKKKRKRRAEDEDDKEDCMPVKKKRKEK